MPEQLDRIEKKVDALYASTEKTRKYFLWTLIVTVVLIALPLLVLPLLLPTFLGSVALPAGF